MNMMMGKIRTQMDKINSLYTKFFENFEAVTRLNDFYIRPEKQKGLIKNNKFSEGSAGIGDSYCALNIQGNFSWGISSTLN